MAIIKNFIKKKKTAKIEKRAVKNSRKTRKKNASMKSGVCRRRENIRRLEHRSQVQMENSTAPLCGNCTISQSASSKMNLSQSELLLLDFFAAFVSFVAVVGCFVNLTVLLAYPKFDQFCDILLISYFFSFLTYLYVYTISLK